MINNGKIRFGCIFMLLLLAAIGYVLYIIIPIKIKAAEFKKAVENYSLQGSFFTHDQIRTGLVEKAKQLGLPVTEKNISIDKTGEYIRIQVRYEVPIDLFGYKTSLKFNPKYENPLY